MKIKTFKNRDYYEEIKDHFTKQGRCFEAHDEFMTLIMEDE
jgi:hypothetical protein